MTSQLVDSLLGDLRDLLTAARRTLGDSARKSADAGRAAARRVVPGPAAPSPIDLDEHLDELGARLERLRAEVADPRLHDRIAVCSRTLRELIEAARALARRDAASALPALDSAHPNAKDARRALAALESAPLETRLRLQRAIVGLLHPHRDLRILALEQVAQQPDPVILPLLEALFAHADARERRAILAAARRVGDLGHALPLLDAALVDEDAGVRLSGIRVLAADEPRGARAAMAVPADTPPPGGAAAARLERALADPDLRVRLEAVRVATLSSDPSLVLPLVRGLMDPTVEVRRAAADAVSRLAGFDVQFDPESAQPERRQAVSALRKRWATARFEHLRASLAGNHGD